ncbi:hypothetical protein [Chryseobacterium sp. JV274]|uniref:hypothetical protein n=1 Tax=Chryseobacterium sp. JV274 TaxID=1932669 RepID=UPI000984E2C4|nr:hypothetical protein [Chryseobacterium sp. JV274]
MIAPQELRLGNYFQESTSKEIIQVESISKDKVGFSGYFTKGWQAEPIELTEEWLLKFGFEKDETVDEIDGVLFVLFHLGDYIVEHWIKENKYKFTDDCAMEVFLSSVHQLQNLTFSLTGEELTIKEEK